MEESAVAQYIQVKNQDLIRLEQFDRKKFTRRQEKVKFFLTMFHLADMLKDDLEATPDEKVDDSKELNEKRKKPKEEDYLCRGHILNALGHVVYNAYRNIGTTKELWTALDNKYCMGEANGFNMLNDDLDLSGPPETQAGPFGSVAISTSRPKKFSSNV
ncbi:hypothetical protein Ddye_004853 [Dipteronia dyeriana]|uniref:Uncharacterized protein n=1 Tax=Dipteronia dyeriana TaxID=168575 RepID=A0AAD9XF06_9ROSI|nr:hypothetical protein Ddye_004853 [Dipteronia dyeriana]